MLFRRRVKPPLMQRIWGMMWPRRGWWRVAEYLFRRLQRLPDTPHGIAAGFAAGVALSLTPFLGIHLLLALALAWLTRGNIVAAALGTLFGNPWTYTFILPGIYSLGIMILGGPEHAISFDDLTLSALVDDLWILLVPMTVGSIVPMLVAWIATYLLVLRAVTGMHQARRARLMARNSPVG